ncbi:hypothetical protein [Nocardia sp. CC201C]|uniref:hypothetical protein n=1 Tax=Nocardia sp. CC201C TaxID=3044575 RepID=UPI0024A8AA64|nr:hypothetical protein [Nocardia sp. CC201C]
MDTTATETTRYQHIRRALATAARRRYPAAITAATRPAVWLLTLAAAVVVGMISAGPTTVTLEFVPAPTTTYAQTSAPTDTTTAGCVMFCDAPTDGGQTRASVLVGTVLAMAA